VDDDFLPVVCLVGEGFVLRSWRPGDEATLVEVLDDPDIERFMNTVPFPYTRDDAHTWVHELAPDISAGGGAAFVIDPGDGGVVGSLSIRRQDRAGGPVGIAGYWVAAPARGRGLAARALRLAAPWAAAHLGLGRQELKHDLANLASCRTATTAGFSATAVVVGGEVHRDGTPRDIERHTWTGPLAPDR
jgi:RimJ/RimL family protein N-acetyltransferase